MSDSKGIFDAATRSESPQQGLRSARGGTELEATVEQMRETAVQLKWCHGGAMLADSMTKTGYPARATLELFLQRGQVWRAVHDEKYESQKRRTKKGLDRLAMEPSDDKTQDEVDDYQNVDSKGKRVDDYQNVDSKGKRVDDYQNVDRTGKKVDDYQNVGNQKAEINMLHSRLRNLLDDDISKDDGIADEALEILEVKNRTRAKQALP